MTESRDTVFLTGISGFVGRHVATSLLESGYNVRALVRSRGDEYESVAARIPQELRSRVEAVRGDLLQAGHLVDSIRGCRYVVHCGALYSFAPADRAAVHDTNVTGTTSLAEAARLAGVERMVVTSSSATVGPARNGRLASERDWAIEGRANGYHNSKIEQERAAIAAQLDTVIILPSAPVGPGDSKPTPTGKMIVDFMRGRIFATLVGGMNVVAVEDVARAHVLGLERGRPNERYLVGGSNLRLPELFGLLATICGRPAPSRQLPYAAAFAVGIGDEIRCRLRPDSIPMVPLEGVRMGRECMYVSTAKAETELGFRPTSVTDALSRAVDWFRNRRYA